MKPETEINGPNLFNKAVVEVAREFDRLNRENERLKTYHLAGCPAIADDESDSVLSDFQECCCGIPKLMERISALQAENAKLREDIDLFPFIGVILLKKWGPAVSGIVGVLDAVMTLAYIRGMHVLGPVVADAALIALSWMDYRQIAIKEKASTAAGSSETMRGGASSDPVGSVRGLLFLPDPGNDGLEDQDSQNHEGGEGDREVLVLVDDACHDQGVDNQGHNGRLILVDLPSPILVHWMASPARQDK